MLCVCSLMFGQLDRASVIWEEGTSAEKNLHTGIGVQDQATRKSAE